MSAPVTGCWTTRQPRRLGRRLTLLAALAAVWCAAGLLAPAPRAAAATLTGSTWSVSSSTTSAAGVSYFFTLTTVTASQLTSIRMTLPTGTAGTPTVGAVSPASIAGGTIARSGTTLTYTFTATTLAAGTAVSIQAGGLTNTATAGTYTTTITTRNGATSVDSGTSGTVVLTTAALTSPAWAATSTVTGAPSTYTFSFTVTGLLGLIGSITMTVPPGTTGTPTLGTVSPGGLLGGSISLTGTTLTYSGISVTLGSGTVVSIQVKGLSNTPTAGTYTSEIVANGLLSTSSGITNSLTFSGPLSLTAPGSLGWSTTLTGARQNLADLNPADQQLGVDDETGTGAGWHLALSATRFTSGTASLANSGTFVVTSLSSVTSTTSPSVTCATSCVPPVNTTAYPVAITTAASSPSQFTIFDTAANTGLGPVTIGGSAAANPVGWWVKVPATALAGTYTSTITIQIISGP